MPRRHVSGSKADASFSTALPSPSNATSAQPPRTGLHVDSSNSDALSEVSLPSSSSSRDSPSLPTNQWRDSKPLLTPTNGISPSTLVGSTIVRIRRSARHPAATLHTADGRVFQVRVDGYHPQHAQVPRALETNAAFAPLFAPCDAQDGRSVQLTVTDCRHISLKDTAMTRGKTGEENKWSVEHLALAFKFEEERGWHCVWATMAEYEDRGPCVYRTYDDVYLDEVKAGRKRQSVIMT